MVSVRIDPETGKLTGANNPEAIFETFREEYLPKEQTATIGNGEQRPAEGDEGSMSQQLF
ncbi:MAG: hypothetical protein HUJ30_00460 [Gammaproteobacteria bacterium]|nr:hypothetical protein [Gammaproteobacteria bacterium]